MLCFLPYFILYTDSLPPVTHKIIIGDDKSKPESSELDYFYEVEYLDPLAIKLLDPKADFDLFFGKCSPHEDVHMIYCYIMQVCAHQQKTDLDKTMNSTSPPPPPPPPPRIMENAHGYFTVHQFYDTRLDSNRS